MLLMVLMSEIALLPAFFAAVIVYGAALLLLVTAARSLERRLAEPGAA